MKGQTYAILLAGGQGTRFWPQSRTLEPKQFLSLHKDKSLFEQTVRRILALASPSRIIIASSELYRLQILESARTFKIPHENLIFEPDGRNTAPSIALAAMLVHRIDPYARICVLPCDHLIKDSRRFLQLLKKGSHVCDGSLVVFGIPPTRPATGYGYIQASGQKSSATGKGIKVKRFTEKPDATTAQKFLKSGDYYWNSGIFMGSSACFLSEFKAHLPLLYKSLAGFRKATDITKIWKRMPSISFDYGILEKSKNLCMLAASGLGWSDLGSWQAWDELLPKNKEGNILKGDCITINSKNITVVGTNRLIATIGLDDLIIVDTPDATLITKKESSEDVKQVVDALKAGKRQEHYTHKTVKRPWGTYTVLDFGDGFKVKEVVVKPRCELSLQFHKKRSEHWVVVEGTARIVRGKKSYVYHANESTYIPVGCVHRLGNPSPAAFLKIIEVQAGKYLEEDDIVRIKDNFGRIK